MERSMSADIDFIEELRLRRSARENYVNPERRQSAWHPVVIDEMRSKDYEASTAFASTA